jgi:hypothetical protein
MTIRASNVGWERRFALISKDREERMDDLERQMEHLRNQMQLTLSRGEGSGRRTALERLRSSLSGFPRRAAARDTGRSGKDAPDSAESPGPTRAPEAGRSSQESTERAEERSRWRRMFRG